MTGKKALENLVHCKSIVKCRERKHKNLCTMERDYTIIERDLKALEIIKTKNVDVFFLRNSCEWVEEYNKAIINDTMYYCYGNCRELTQEEFDLLIGVLEDEQD